VERAAEAYERLVAEPSERPLGALVLAYGDATANGNGDLKLRKLEVETAEPRPARRAAGPVGVGLVGPGGFAARVLVPALVVGGGRRRVLQALVLRLRDFRVPRAPAVASAYRASAARLPEPHLAHDLEQGRGRLIGECGHAVDSLDFLNEAEAEEVHAARYGN